MFTSAVLADLWKYGSHQIGAITFESAAYVARYVTKKITGDAAEDHYQRVDVRTGEVHVVEPEFALMSRRPGIGAEWFERFGSEVFPDDEVIVKGHPCKPPRFYETRLEAARPEVHQEVKGKREQNRKLHRSDNTPERRRARRVIREARMSQLKRGYENADS